MDRKRCTTDQIITKLREEEVPLAQGKIVVQVDGNSRTDLLRWRQEYGELKINQAKRLKPQEKENGRLRKLVADLSLDNQILMNVSFGNS